MDKQISHFIEVGVCVIFAVITMMMLMASFRLQRDAAVAAEKKQFFELTAANKNKYARYDGEEVGASELISIISQYADKIEIYVDKTSGSTYEFCITDFNRYIAEELTQTSTTSNLKEIWAGYSTDLNGSTDWAKQYGLLSGTALGKIFYGDSRWTVYTIYDNCDVTSHSSVGMRGDNSVVTGFRIIMVQ